MGAIQSKGREKVMIGVVSRNVHITQTSLKLNSSSGNM